MKNKEFDKISESLNLTDDFFDKAKQLKSEINKQQTLTYIAGAISVLSFLINALSMMNYGFIIITIICSIVTIVINRRLSKLKEEYSTFVKDNVVSSMFEKELDHINFRPDQGFDKEYIRSTKMYQMGNVFDSNDLLMGTYKGVGFTQADVLIQDESTDSEGHTTTTTLFRGRWLIYDFNKDFTGNLQLRSNYGRLFFKNKKVKSWFSKNDLEPINYENQEFNELFNAYTNNSHDAYYIITPHMMDSMIALNKKLDCEIIISFIDNKLHIAIYNDEDAFEIGTNEVDIKFIKQVEQEIALIKFIVDGLDLSKDIFKDTDEDIVIHQ